MRKILMFIVFVFVSSVMFSQDANTVIMTIGDREITKGEFEYLFYKNNDEKNVTLKDVKEYSDLFVNFKLKVLEAEARKLDTVPTFITELDGYRSQLAKPYMTDRDLDEKLLLSAYERLKEEVEASHILVQIPEGSSPADTLSAYNKAIEVRSRAMKGEDFAALAKQFSSDPSAVDNGGYLGYFKGFQMVLPFEDGAFNTPVGEVSAPVRSSFGYHIIKVHNRRKSPGEVMVAHIMRAASADAPDEVRMQAEKEIFDILYKLKMGGSFEELAKEHSDDYTTAEHGGRLNWFSTGQMVKPFENAAFALVNKDDISEPVKTDFGWHIIKLIDKRDILPYEELKEKISNRLLRDDRGTMAHESFIKKLEKEYNITKHKENIDEFVGISKKYTYRDSMFQVVTRGMSKPVLTINGVDYSQEHFADYLVRNPRGEVPSEEERVNLKFSRYYDETIMAYENSVLEKKYPDFGYLMNEYHDGLLLFEISSTEIWDKASQDTVGLEKFYAKNKKQYRWDEPHYTGKIFYCLNDSVVDVVKGLLKNKASDLEILQKVNETGPFVNIVSGIYTKGMNDVVDFYLWGGEAYKPFKLFEKAFIEGKSFEPGAVKELEACRGMVISDYQNYLEESWIKSLRKKYKVKIDKKVLLSLVTAK